MTTDLLDPPLAPEEPARLGSPRRRRRPSREALFAVGAFAFLTAVVLSKAPQLLEPDDYAYRASIVALTHGELLLTTAQYHALVHQLGSVAQWHHLKSGYWISEKNPGYPFLAVVFDLVGILRLTPLFYGALASVSLYLGGRRWLGPRGGALAVGLFCTSGAALAFAWRATMPTFSDASLIACGAGLLLWVVCALDAPTTRRASVASLASLAFMAAAFVRYTDVFVAIVAALAVVVAWRVRRLPRVVAITSLVVTAVSGVGIMIFNTLVYGHPLSTGYSAGEITFSIGSIPSNLVHMPAPLVVAMPVSLLAAGALVGIAVRRAQRTDDGSFDLWVAGALALGWASIWGLYLAYTWTVGQPTSVTNSIHVIRFYVPVLGLVALLGAWLLTRLRVSASWGVVALAAVLGVLSFTSLTSGGGPGGPGGGPGGGPPGLGGHHGLPTGPPGGVGSPPGSGPGPS